jgi:hypothetical protein
MNVLHTRYISGNTADSVFDLERARFHLWNSSLSPWHANEASMVTTALMTDGNTHSLSEAEVQPYSQPTHNKLHNVTDKEKISFSVSTE